ncbi:lysosomal cholesterol signaling protein isoform X2 [Anabrus simplex]|uniref:lysosomal cholesterol signaling protein isoform X2 n=1 Tax=Anabrus simplex TaxID=316456 RepID=UPI0035A34316
MLCHHHIYVAGRQNLIGQTEVKGLNTFVGTFSLPALIFLSLAQLDLHAVNWMFLLAILIAKGLVFGVVIVITLMINRPMNPGRAGLFAIFCTQSNDFAIGYPIVLALYEKTHPEYASYLYLMAPISLAILNPLGFILMEIGKQQHRNMDDAVELVEKKSSLRMAMSVARSILLNPVVFMTALGIIGNLMFAHHIPAILLGLLKVLGSAFSATALFVLGHRMVGKVHTLQGKALVVPGILIAVKVLVLPLVNREVVSLLHSGSNTSDTSDLSTYGFLYGTFPAAPGVFVFANQYGIDIDLIASSMVACTFLSAPLMFVSAKMITVNKMDPCNYLEELDSFAFDVSIVGIIVCVWLLCMFFCSKSFKRIPHRATFCLIISQLIGCVGVVLWSLLDRNQAWSLYLQFAVYTVGVYSSRLWTAFLAITLLFFECRSLCFVLKLQPFFIVLGWGIPLMMVTLLMLCVEQDTMAVEKRNPNFQYGETQAAVTVFLLIFCFTVTVGCLVFHQRYRRRYAQYRLLLQDTSNHDISGDSETDTEIGGKESVNSCVDTAQGGSIQVPGCSSKHITDIEDMGLNVGRDLCPSQFKCPATIRNQCHNHVDRYHQEEEELEEVQNEHQILRHLVLLILLVCSMFVGIAFSVWTLVMEEMSGIYVELAFLDASLNFGQSLIVFAVFGLDTKAVILPLVKRWRRFWYGSPTLKLPEWDDLDFETRHVCDQFVSHHLEKCNRDIARNKRWRLKQHNQVFTGTAMIDWLLKMGLAKDRADAVHYASLLLEGKVLKHVDEIHHFHDRSLLYKFNMDK